MTKAFRQVCVTAVGTALALALVLALVGWHAKPGSAQEGGGPSGGAAPENEPKVPSPAGGEPSPLGRTDEDANGNEYVSGELVVSYASDAAEKADGRAKQDRTARVAKVLDEVDAQLVVSEEVKGIGDRAEREGALAEKKEEIEAQPGVESVTYNYVSRQMWTPNDYYFSPRDGSDQWQLRQARAPSGWDQTRGRGAGVRIAVIDSGYDNTHAEFASKVVAQKDFLRGDPYADEEQYHGTAVASVASARTNNRAGIAGAAPDSQLMIAKVTDSQGYSSIADSAEAVLWAANNGARVINMSFGGTTYNQAFKDAIDYAYLKKNALPVCSAGNTGAYTRGTYPAGYASCLTVGASNAAGSGRAPYSSYGPDVDVVAPTGSGVLVAKSTRIANTPQNSYMLIQGATSWSAPVVSGLAADVVGRKPSLTGPKIRAAVQRYADDLGPAGRDDQTGYGRINFKRSITNAPGL